MPTATRIKNVNHRFGVDDEFLYFVKLDIGEGVEVEHAFTPHAIQAAAQRAKRSPKDLPHPEPKPEPVSIWRRLFGKGVKG